MEMLLLNWQKNYWGNMANVEQISQVAMQVITYSGLAKSNYLEALKYYRENDQTAYEQAMSNGDESISQANGISTYVSRNNKDFDSRNNFINRKQR